MKIKKFFVDVETTGTNPSVHGIHQISGIIDIDGKVVESFDLKIKPFQDCEVSEEALEVCGKTLEDLENNPYTEKEAFDKMMRIFAKHVNRYDKKDKFFVVGFNVRFDCDMLRAFYERNDIDNPKGKFMWGCYFWNNHIDVLSKATDKLMKLRPFMENFKLGTICNRLNLIDPETENLHDSMFDIEITRQLYYFLENSIIDIQVKENKCVVVDLSKMNTNNDITDLLQLFEFGKYKGKSVTEILDFDPQYFIWLKENGYNVSQDIIDSINPKKTFTEESALPFGKYKGKLIKDVLLTDPKYIAWISTEVKDLFFKFTDETLNTLCNINKKPKHIVKSKESTADYLINSHLDRGDIYDDIPF